MDELLFKVTGPNGEIYEIFKDGHISGFPDGSSIVNYAAVHFAKLNAQLREALKHG